MRFAPLALAALLALSACRTEHPRQVPPATTIPTYEQAARTAPDVVGTYELIGLNIHDIPTEAAFVDGCPVHLEAGTITLGPDARYRLAFDVRHDCDRAPVQPAATEAPGAERTTLEKEGLYTVVGHRVLFGSKIRLTNRELAPEQSTGPQHLHYALFDGGRLDANGAVRDTVLTITFDDLRTYVFRRERGAPPPATAPTPRDLTAPIAPPDRPVPTEGEAAREGVLPN